MQEPEVVGAVVLANRYDGIDLPGDACRVLILDGLPKGMSNYDMFRSNVLSGSVINSTLAQRVEQGIGRAARGASDYCVVILFGPDLVSWLGHVGSMEFLTAATRCQIEIGRTLSKEIKSPKDFIATVQQCLKRDKEWKQYHAEELSGAAAPSTPDKIRIDLAVNEYHAIEQMRLGRFADAARTLQKAADSAPDDFVKGWLLQLCARAHQLNNDPNTAQKLQSSAYYHNRQLTRPSVGVPYKSAVSPDDQATSIARIIRSFVEPQACLYDFDLKTASLNPGASANQFEEALRALGNFLGFTSERPEHDFKTGPDNLWRTNDDFDFVIEAKNQKKEPSKALTKEEHGQLLVARAWYEKTFPSRRGICVSVHPNKFATKNANAEDTRVLTLAALADLVSDARAFIRDLCMIECMENLEAACAEGLRNRKLSPKAIFKRLVEFSVREE